MYGSASASIWALMVALVGLGVPVGFVVMDKKKGRGEDSLILHEQKNGGCNNASRRIFAARPALLDGNALGRRGCFLRQCQFQHAIRVLRVRRVFVDLAAQYKRTVQLAD